MQKCSVVRTSCGGWGLRGDGGGYIFTLSAPPKGSRKAVLFVDSWEPSTSSE